MIPPRRNGSSDGFVERLRAVCGERVSTSQSVREHHSHGESWHAPGLPDAVVFPTSTDDVSRVVRVCAASRVPIVPFGMGSSVEGHVNAIHGGVTIDLTRMTRVQRISADDLDVTVEAGITRSMLDDHLRNTGLMFPLDPGADATIGGMAATRASGTTAVRYGTMRENVLGLTVVLADGRIIRTGGRARKSSSGYDLTRLFVGSEGTLGVITEVTLRLYGRPEAVRAAVCPFTSMDGAAKAVIQTIQLGIPVARIEIVDEAQLRMVNAYSKTAYPVAPTLFFEFHGISAAAVDDQIRAVEEIAHQHGAREFRWAASPEERATLWRARHNAYYAVAASRPGARPWTTDVCVPIGELAACILETQADLGETGIEAPLVGHAGDGNFHLTLMLDADDAREVQTAAAFSERLVERSLRLGGTCSGEHGVGIGKRRYLTREHGEAVEVMRLIKQALDPHDLMNPGKLIPDA
ncbi:MAG TPA: FAD-linked oxidase C-terminal domain-containing protein [Vicinamibacterales bacterium]|nr:FAD-linked oxidase C-terminal domain-containing protein [Vicinamibacterales bacterium]